MINQYYIHSRFLYSNEYRCKSEPDDSLEQSEIDKLINGEKSRKESKYNNSARLRFVNRNTKKSKKKRRRRGKKTHRR